MHQKAYHKSKVNYQNYTDKPLYARHSTLCKAKSAISYYMPDDSSWNEDHQCGNPTKSGPVNTVLRRVADMEGKDLGAKSCEKRDMTESEFRKMVEILGQYLGLFSHWCLAVTYAVLAFHLIFRSDCVSWLMYQDVKPHPRFDFALSLRVRYSKNIGGGRVVPPQIVLGSMDTTFCALLHLAIYMETSLMRGSAAAGYEKAFLFTDDLSVDEEGVPNGPRRINSKFQGICTRIFKRCKEFVELLEQLGGSLGSHSIRKFAATFASRLGIGLPEIDYRGRWKSKDEREHKVAAMYVNKDHAFVDATVAAVLCHNQPIAYRPHKDAVGVTPEWLQENVIPFLTQFYSHGCTPADNPVMVLAYPLLWAAMSPEMEGKMDPEHRQKIRDAYSKIDSLPAGVNPVVRVGLRVGRVKDLVVINEVAPEATPVGDDSPAAEVARANGVVPLTLTSTSASSIDTKVVLDQMFTYHQQQAKMIENLHRTNEAKIGAIYSMFDGHLSTINHHMCR